MYFYYYLTSIVILMRLLSIDSSRIDLSNATVEELEDLSQACDPATFGLNQNDVLDESYRKAWKLDSDYFCIQARS